MASNSTHYTEAFYEGHQNGSLRSARAIAPIVYDLCPIDSVLDVGCGIGQWLLAFKECGAKKVVGVDGQYVNHSQLLISPSEFSPVDLSKTQSLPAGFDLVVCTEVLEHLTDTVGDRLVHAMTKSAPLVLFSAAIPGQGGTFHVNERWHHHWHSKFAECGFSVLDIIRPRIFADSTIDVWYRQNVFLYANPEAFARHDSLRFASAESPPRMVPIDPAILSQFMSVRGLLRHVALRLKQKFLF